MSDIDKKTIKQQQELFESLDELCDSNKSRIIEWLGDISSEYNGVHNNKISNLLTKSKIPINTKNEYDVYNSILQWFLNNKEQFTDSDDLDLFDNIPSTTFTTISKAIMMQKIDILEAIKKWKSNPNINPYNGSIVKTSIVSKSKYAKLYQTFITHLSKDSSFEKIRKQLPTNHIYVLEDIDYLEKLKQQNTDEQDDKWIDFLIKNKNIIYTKEQILDKKGYTVYDHLFMHFCFKKSDSRQNIDKQFFLYQTIENQIKLVKAVDMNCYEVIDSMLKFTSEEDKGINFQVKRMTLVQDEWSYYVPPLLNLFIQYVYEIINYLIPIQGLNTIIFDNYFLYGNKIPRLKLDNEKKIEVIDYSIKYNKYRLKTILNLILGSMYNSDNSEKIDIKTFLKILWEQVKDVLFEKQKFYTNRRFLYPESPERVLYLDITKTIGEAEIKNIKSFFVSSIFDIETLHKESQEHNNVLYEPVIDPYNNLPEPPKMPRRPVISQYLQRYKMTSHIKGKNSEKEKELKEYLEKEKQFKKELKSYDKKLKEYNDKHLGKKLSPYFSVKLSRAKSVINDKNSLRLSYSSLKVSAKSLTKFKSSKNKELLSKFEKEPYSRTYKKKKEDENVLWKEKEYRQRAKESETDIIFYRERERKERERWERNVITLQERERERERERQAWEAVIAPERERERVSWEQNVRMLQEGERETERAGETNANSEPTNNTNSQRQTERERRRERARERMEAIYRGQTIAGGGSKEPLSKSDLKLKLALEAHKFKEFAKSLSPSGKSPRQKYIGCDLNDNDPITQETLKDLHFKKIKYLSKIKTTLSDGKIVTHCYDTIPLYNYILDCNNKGDIPLNLAIGKVPLTQQQKKEVFKKIKFFTKQPTLEININTTKKYFLKANYKPSEHSEDHYTTYDLYAQINIGSIDFNLSGNMAFIIHKAPIISRDDMLFEDTSDETVLLIQKGMENGSLLRVNSYPYWKSDIFTIRIRNDKILLLPPFTFSTRDSIQELEERTKVFNNRLRILI